MTTPADPAAPVAPAAAPTIPAAPAPLAPGAAPAPVLEPEDPAFMAARLARHTTSVLKDLGFASPEEARAAGEAARAAAQAKLTLEEKLANQQTALTQTSAQLATANAAIAQRATRELGALTADQQAAVIAAAGEDNAARLRVIDALKPTWVVAVPPAPAPVPGAPAPKPPVPAGGSSAPAPAAPAAPPAPSGDVNHVAVHAAISNPFVAAAYRVKHLAAFGDNDA